MIPSGNILIKGTSLCLDWSTWIMADPWSISRMAWKERKQTVHLSELCRLLWQRTTDQWPKTWRLSSHRHSICKSMFLPRGETILPLSRLGNVAFLVSLSPDFCLYLLMIVSLYLYLCLGPNFPFHRGFSHFGLEPSMLSYDFILGNTSATTIFPNKATFRSAGEAGFDC